MIIQLQFSEIMGCANLFQRLLTVAVYCVSTPSPRFLCLLTALINLLVAVQRQSVLYTENSGFASPTLGQHISTFRGYRILFSIINLI